MTTTRTMTALVAAAFVLVLVYVATSSSVGDFLFGPPQDDLAPYNTRESQYREKIAAFETKRLFARDAALRACPASTTDLTILFPHIRKAGGSTFKRTFSTYKYPEGLPFLVSNPFREASPIKSYRVISGFLHADVRGVGEAASERGYCRRMGGMDEDRGDFGWNCTSTGVSPPHGMRSMGVDAARPLPADHLRL